MKGALHIAAVVHQSEQLERLVEGMATCRYAAGYRKQPVPADWQLLDTFSVGAYAAGVMTLHEGRRQFNLPFEAAFYFTCIRTADGPYKMAWAVALS